ncbi:unnamed protein product [Closterium sp. Naga37s-1]|nr:unnamed protein product [Closterium sp. Naga37s-1]
MRLPPHLAPPCPFRTKNGSSSARWMGSLQSPLFQSTSFLGVFAQKLLAAQQCLRISALLLSAAAADRGAFPHSLPSRQLVRVVRPSFSPCLFVFPMGSDGCFKSDVVVGVACMGLSEKGKGEGGVRSGVEEGGWAKWPVNGAEGVENGAAAVKNGFVHPYECTNPSSAVTGCAYNEPKVQPVTAAPGSHCYSAVPRMNPLKPGKPVACVLGIGTANPDTIRPQGQFAKEYLSRVGCHHAETQAKFERICYHTGIDKRHMVLPWDTIAANPCLQEFGAPSLAMRQEILHTEGVKLAAAACERALAEWGGDRAGVGGVGGAGGEGSGAGGITHLVVVTVSGVHLPGLDVQLVEALGLRRSTQRVLLQMLGCYAGVTALRIAKDLAENNADEGARVLLVCSELNSLIFQAPHESLPDSLVCAAIFGDGAAAMVVGANPRTHASHAIHAAPAAPALQEATTSPQQQQQQQGSPPPSPSPPAGLSPEKPIFEIVRVAEFFLPETTRHIAGDLTEAGLLVHLRREVPLLLPGPVKDFSAALLGQAGVGFAESFWAVHPGGRAILDAIQRNLGLKKHALKASRLVWRAFPGEASVSLMSSSATPSFAEAPSPYELSSLEAALEQQPAILVVVASALVLVYLVAGELGRSRGW